MFRAFAEFTCICVCLDMLTCLCVCLYMFMWLRVFILMQGGIFVCACVYGWMDGCVGIYEYVQVLPKLPDLQMKGLTIWSPCREES